MVPPPIPGALGAQVRRYDRKIRNSFLEGVTLEIGRVSKTLQVGMKSHCPLSRGVWHSVGWEGSELSRGDSGHPGQLERAVSVGACGAARWACSSHR